VDLAVGDGVVSLQTLVVGRLEMVAGLTLGAGLVLAVEETERDLVSHGDQGALVVDEVVLRVAATTFARP
jgi:hypothetical protein